MATIIAWLIFPLFFWTALLSDLTYKDDNNGANGADTCNNVHDGEDACFYFMSVAIYQVPCTYYIFLQIAWLVDKSIINMEVIKWSDLMGNLRVIKISDFLKASEIW